MNTISTRPVCSAIGVAVLSFAFSLRADERSANSPPVADDELLKSLAASSAVEILIRNPRHDPGWLRDCDALVRKDGTGVVTFPSELKDPRPREFGLSPAERAVLLQQVLEGLNEFEIESAHSESDKCDLRLKVTAGTTKITAIGCFSNDFVVIPLKAMTIKVQNPMRFPENREPRETDSHLGEAKRIAIRRDKPFKLNRAALLLEVSSGDRRLARVALGSNGYLQTETTDQFPQLSKFDKRLKPEDRDEIYRSAYRALERFALTKPRDRENRPDEMRRYKLSIGGRYGGLDIDEADIDSNPEFRDDVLKLINSVAKVVERNARP